MGLDILSSKRKQALLVLTESDRAEQRKGEVEMGYCVDHKNQMAWPLATAGSQYWDGRQYVQVVSERDIVPIPLWRTKPDVKLAENVRTRIAEDAIRRARLEIEKKSKQHLLAWMLGTVIVCLTIAVLAMIIAGMFQSGKVHMPW